LQGGILITDQITDHYAPYCSELRTTAINEIRVLAECWRMGYQHNTLSVRHHILIIPVSGISGTIPAQDQGFTTALWG
jgi:hypothetical protein